MKDNQLHRLQRQISDDLQFMALTLTNQAVDTNARFRGVSDQMDTMAEQLNSMARQMSSSGEQLRQISADSEDRYNQLAGRMRLLDQRLETFLGAADREQRHLGKRYADLDKRVSRLEERAGGSGSA